MGRIIKTIEIGGQPAVALFDTGAFHSYVRRPLLGSAPVFAVATPYKVAIGGGTIEVREQAFVNGAIEGLPFTMGVVPVQDLGKADGHALDAIVGATTMEEWEIRLDPKAGTLDLEGLRRREFTEY